MTQKKENAKKKTQRKVKKNISQKLKKGSVYSHFELQSRKKYSEIDSIVNTFKHERLGTKVIFIENDDTKRAFQVTFRTPSESSQGVQHILEHSVLRGSRKYDFGNGETFAILLQNSMPSFLNAVTSPDSNYYPFSTNVESEFFKIMDVYLDAVFFPNVVHDKNFFRKEGWRYDMDEDGNVFYNGVVFNEMKGRLADINGIREKNIAQIMFPDTQSGFNAGGNPEEIVNLTWEKLSQYQKDHYHPTNATIYIYGKVDVQKVLENIEREFLAKEIPDKNGEMMVGFTKGKKASKIKLQKKFAPLSKKVKFSAATKEENSDLTLAFLSQKIDQVENIQILNFILGFLESSESSILKRNILKSGLASDFYSYVEYDYIQYYSQFTFAGIDGKDKKKIEKIFWDSLDQIIKNGIDRKALKSYLASFEYGQILQKYNSERGLSVINKIHRYNNHDLDFDHVFMPKKMIAILKKAVQKKPGERDSLEKMLQKYVQKNKSQVSLFLEADTKYNPYLSLDKKLAKINKNKKSKRFKEIESEIEEFRNFEQENQKETSKILPPKKSQIPKKPQKAKVLKKDVLAGKNTVKYAYAKLPEKNIKKVSLSFDAFSVEEQDVQYFKLCASLLEKLSIRGVERRDFENQKNALFGQISFSDYITKNIQTGKSYMRFFVRYGYMLRNEKKALLLLDKIFTDIDFESLEAQRIIGENIKIMVKDLKEQFAYSGHVYALTRAASRGSVYGTLKEKMAGLEYVLFLEKVQKIYEKSPQEIIQKLKVVYEKMISLDDLRISVSAHEKDFKVHKNFTLSEKKQKKHQYKDMYEKDVNEAIIVDSLVNTFNTIATEPCEWKGKIKEKDRIDRKFFLISNFLNYEYLWKKIREEGGAYGGGFLPVNHNHNIQMYSYMDSRVAGTYNDYNAISKYLQSKGVQEEFKGDSGDEKMRGLLASSLKDFLNPISPITAPENSTIEEMTGYDEEEKKKVIQSILSFEVRDFKKLGQDLEKRMKKISKVTIGSKEKIMKDKKNFDSIWELK